MGWRQAVGYEGLYEVNDDGEVRSVAHITNGVHVPSKKLKPYMSDRYYRVKLYKDGKPKMVMVHRLVAQAFIGNPHKLPQVNHINGDRTDNSASNLEWCTASENQKHAIRTGLKDPEDTVKATRKKVLQLDMSGNVINEWRSLSDAARALGLQVSNISHCCKGRIGSTGGYKWRLVSDR